MTVLAHPAAGLAAATTEHDGKVALTVEVCVRADSPADLGAVRAAALAFLGSLSSVRYAEGPLAPPAGQHPLLDAHVESIAVVDLGARLPPNKLLLSWDVAWQASRLGSAPRVLGGPRCRPCLLACSPAAVPISAAAARPAAAHQPSIAAAAPPRAGASVPARQRGAR